MRNLLVRFSVLAANLLFLAPFAARAQTCFSAENDPLIARAITPIAAYHETEETIEQIHDLIFSYRNELDPRLVYYRMLGESRGNPYAVNPRSGAYGLFQMLGRPYGSSRTYRQILQGLQAQHPSDSPRLIQVRYYLSTYVANFARAANQGYGCARKPYAQYSPIERASYLGWGSCSARTLQTERSLCRYNANYRSSGACAIVAPLYQGEAPAICGGS